MPTATNAQLVNLLLDQMEGPWGRSPQTCHQYRNGYARFLDFSTKPLTATTTHDLELYLARRPCAPATSAWELAILSTLFRYLNENLGLIRTNPAKVLVKPRIHNDNPKPVPEDLWLKLWFSNLYDDERVALGLGYFCGLRRAEIVGLKVGQFIDAPYPLITSVKRKGGKRQGMRWASCIKLYERLLPDLIGDPELFNGALARLRERPISGSLLPWREPQDTADNAHETRAITELEGSVLGSAKNYLVANPRPTGRGKAPAKRRATTFQAQPDAYAPGFIPPDTMNDRLRTLCGRIGVPERTITPHMLRHSFGTNLCRAGVKIEVVAALMGHSDPKVTMRYVQTGDDPLGDFLDDLGDLGPDELRQVRRW